MFLRLPLKLRTYLHICIFTYILNTDTFIQDFNINFHLSSENSENSALNKLPMYDIFDMNNRNRPEVGMILNALHIP